MLTFMRLEILTYALDDHEGEGGTAREVEVAVGRVRAATMQCPGAAGIFTVLTVVISVINKIKRCLGLEIA